MRFTPVAVYSMYMVALLQKYIFVSHESIVVFTYIN